MKKILGIEIPANLGELSTPAIKALGKSLVAAIREKGTGEVGPELLAELAEAKTLAQSLSEMIGERKTADDQLAADRAAVLSDADELDAAFEDDAEDDDAEGDAEGDASDDADADAEGDTEGDADAGDKADADAITAGARTPYRPTAKGIASASDKGSDKPPAATPPTNLGTFKAAANLKNVNAGDEFSSNIELADELAARWNDIKGGGGKTRVATLELPKAAFTQLGTNMAENAKLLSSYDPAKPNALTAAICAPRDQIYDSVGAVVSSVARPVKGSLMNVSPPHGGFSLYPTPKLSDVDGGYGIWTRADDADAEALKTCGTIPCASSEDYDIYAIYRCLTVKNMMALTFPELVAAILNRLQALQARMAEVALLDAMLASVNVKNVLATADGQGAAINLYSTILNAVAIYREEERLGDQAFDAWLPRWVLPALQIDLFRQRRTSGQLRDRLPNRAEIEASFRDSGLSVTWTMDTATSWSPVPVIDDGDVLPSLPTDIDILFTPSGNFKAMDRGNQDLGVTNNILRDNAGNARNEFTMWWESYEGILDQGAVSYALHLDGVCLNGRQVADVEAIDCLAGS